MTAKTMYVRIWAVLLFLLGVSIALGYLSHPVLATSLIFGIAAIKAYIVGAYYMRLKWEPRYIVWVLLFAVGLIAILYFTLVPDIVYVYGK